MAYSWYPGHMAKAVKEIKPLLKIIDVIIELVDARAPMSSSNPLLVELSSRKPSIVLLNKADLAEEVAKILGVRTEAKAVVDRVFEAMRRALRDGDKVVAHGFGSFHVVMRKSKPARNPRTGQAVVIPPRRRVKFRMAKDLLTPPNGE